MPWRTVQLLAFISCVHVIVNIVNKKTISCRLITLEDNFFLSLLLHIIKVKRTPLGHRSTVFLEKTRFITFIYRTVRKDVYRKCLQSRCFGTVTSSKNGRRDRRYYRFAENYNSSKKAVNLTHDDTSRNHCSCVLYRV